MEPEQYCDGAGRCVICDDPLLAHVRFVEMGRDLATARAQCAALREALQSCHTHYGVYNPEPHPTCRWCAILADHDAHARAWGG